MEAGGWGILGRGDSLGSAETSERGLKYPAEELAFSCEQRGAMERVRGWEKPSQISRMVWTGRGRLGPQDPHIQVRQGVQARAERN